MSHNDQKPDAACEQCGLTATRREFVRELSLSIAGIVASLGIGSRAAEALPVRAVAALAREGDRHVYPIPAEDGVEIDRKAEIIVVRWSGALYAFNLSCPHQHTALRWINKD